MCCGSSGGVIVAIIMMAVTAIVLVTKTKHVHKKMGIDERVRIKSRLVAEGVRV